MALKDDPLLKAYVHAVSNRKSQLSSVITAGKCTSFEDYKRMTGTIAGLDAALALLDDAIQHYTQDDDDFE